MALLRFLLVGHLVLFGITIYPTLFAINLGRHRHNVNIKNGRQKSEIRIQRTEDRIQNYEYALVVLGPVVGRFWSYYRRWLT